MVRTALRLSTIAALLNGGNEPYPTLAGGFVFDSRIAAVNDLTAEMRVPVIIVRTDDDRRGQRGMQRTLVLRMELSVLTGRKDADGTVPEWVTTDAGLEAMLDLLEWQVEAALFGSSPWAHWWKNLWGREESASIPLYTPPSQGKIRLAVREISMTLRVPIDCIPKPVHAEDPLPPAALQDPLVEVFSRIASKGAGDIKTAAGQIRAALEAQDLPVATQYPPLSFMRGQLSQSFDPTPHPDVEFGPTLPTPPP